MDNRLDFINKFIDEKEAAEQMTIIRNLFMTLDRAIVAIHEHTRGASNYSHAFVRSVAHSRSSLEVSLQYTIKALCLKHEAK